MKSSALWLALAGLTLGAICAALGLLALGGAVSARLDVLSHLAPLWIVGAILSLAMAAARARAMRGPTALLATVAVASGVTLIAPEFLRSTGPVALPGGPGQLKVIQFNASRDNPRVGRIVDWLVAERPDVVMIEEATPALRDAILARTGWHVAGAATTAMIFTPAPYLVMHRPRVEPGSKLVWVNATYASASGPFEAVVTHFTWPTQGIHRAQSLAMRRVLAALPRDRTILAGDFNSTPWSSIRRADDRAFGLVRRDRALASWPADRVGARGLAAPFPFLPIDHVYAGRGWATVSVRRGPRLGSDHYPVVVTLAPTASPTARAGAWATSAAVNARSTAANSSMIPLGSRK